MLWTLLQSLNNFLEFLTEIILENMKIIYLGCENKGSKIDVMIK